MKIISITESEAGERVDSFLAKKFPEYSRNYFSNLIADKNVSVNSKSVKSSYKLKVGDQISVEFVEKEANELKAEEIALDIIYEDDDVIVLNKKPGIVVHPAAGNASGTLVNALLNYFPAIKHAVYDEASEVSKIRPGLVHRLDKDTSGVMIVAKNARAMHSLSRQIQNRSIKKVYWALCSGWPKNDEGNLVNYLGRHPKNRKLIADIGKEKGRESISYYKVLRYLKDDKENKICLVEFDIKTGRTHQIRVQSAIMGNPVIGDKAYGSKQCLKISEELGATRQLLHAKSLSVSLPGDTKQSVFDAPLPEDFKNILDKLKKAY